MAPTADSRARASLWYSGLVWALHYTIFNIIHIHAVGYINAPELEELPDPGTKLPEEGVGHPVVGSLQGALRPQVDGLDRGEASVHHLTALQGAAKLIHIGDLEGFSKMGFGPM